MFGVVSAGDCVKDLFYGIDYHSHLGTSYGGLAVKNHEGFSRAIHDISGSQFRAEFQKDIEGICSSQGIGVVSDTDPQPLIPHSSLGEYAIVTVGRVNNLNNIVSNAFRSVGGVHFLDRSGGKTNPTEVVAHLINQKDSFEDGIAHAQSVIDGSCSMLLLTERGLYAARDRFGRTPLVLGEKNGSYAVSSESTAFPNLGFNVLRDLGPGEVVLINQEGIKQRKQPGRETQICAFLWIYFGYPSSSYEGISVEAARYRCGAALARRDKANPLQVDLVAGIPDSGTSHALGYAAESGMPSERPFVKYTPTWPRSFMPQEQEERDLVARMKLVPIPDLIKGKRLLFCEDSIVRGTQLKQTIQRLFDYGAEEVHMRPACPPLVFGCKYLNFSRSKDEFALAARRAIKKIEGRKKFNITPYLDEDSEKHARMVDFIRKELGLTSLRYQRLDDLIKAIGLGREKLCLGCWTPS